MLYLEDFKVKIIKINIFYSIQEIIKNNKLKDSVFRFGMMELNMKDNLKIVKNMGMVYKQA